ncbi:hypothetical protein DV737_g1012, partial [Chaetothyriales sp. CBS 132003]
MVFLALASRVRTSTLFRRLSGDTSPLATSRPSWTYIGLSTVSLLCTTALFRTYAYDYSFGSGESMLMTLPDQGVVNVYSRFYRHGKGLKVGDLVCARSPTFPNSYVGKRVLGLPGDYVVADANGDATVGGVMHHGIRGNGGREALATERTEPRMYRVPEGHVWLAGDNLGGSRDSRSLGPVPLAMIEGKSVWMGDGWFDWTYVGGDWTQGQMRIIDARKRAKQGRAVTAEEERG